jgi:hypothetical protein
MIDKTIINKYVHLIDRDLSQEQVLTEILGSTQLVTLGDTILIRTINIGNLKVTHKLATIKSFEGGKVLTN